MPRLAMTACPVLLLAALLTGCGYRAIPQAKNKVEAALSEVTSQYKRRADLIPNLVEVVKGYAGHEKETLEGVINARSRATSIQLTTDDISPEKVQQFQQAQGSLSQALGRLMVVAERYPDLKANQNFRDLQAQLEGTENRITVARNRHIEAIREFNDLITVPPESWTNSMFYHYEKMPQWTVSEEERTNIERAPAVKF